MHHRQIHVRTSAAALHASHVSCSGISNMSQRDQAACVVPDRLPLK